MPFGMLSVQFRLVIPGDHELDPDPDPDLGPDPDPAFIPEWSRGRSGVACFQLGVGVCRILTLT